MPSRKVKRRPLTEVNCGDLDTRIDLIVRELRPAGYGSYDATETYVTMDTVWAMAETLMGKIEFNEVNTQERPTHRFTIRYRDDVTTEIIIEHQYKRFTIVEVTNYEERNEYLVLDCKFLGHIEKEANL